MGDLQHDDDALTQVQYRIDTYGGQKLAIDTDVLAQAGFYYTREGEEVKCFSCNLELDVKAISQGANVARLHKEKQPNCKFAKTLHVVPKPARSKMFISYDSLRFEKERLETFIDWPLKWLHPAELASEGFYYLRTADHCACVFCRGIVGAWEVGDTPRGEHQRHFPHCPFLRGAPVGNVPTIQSNILAGLPAGQDAPACPPPPKPQGEDLCGTPRHMPGSYPECRGAPTKPDISLDEIGLPQYSGPKRKDYLTYESRLASFVKWPERVSQKPSDLADAGFYYCGLSDHVRCFHCGKGLRNWEKDDLPWNEHARWYTECNYVLLKKGQDFIDKVRREKPPYIRSQPKPSTSQSAGGSATALPKKHTVTEKDLDPLMDLDIIKGVMGMGFPPRAVSAALKNHIEETGMPYFSMEACIEAVLQIMEEETRLTILKDIQHEATEGQSGKMQNFQRRSDPSSGASTSSTNTPAPEPVAVTSPSSPVVPAASSTPLPTLPAFVPAASSTPLPTLPAIVPAATTTPLPTLPNSTSSSAVESVDEVTSNIPTTSEATETATTSQTPMVVDEPLIDETESIPPAPQAASQVNPVEHVIMQANEVMSMAEEALKPPISWPSSLNELKVQLNGEGQETNTLPSSSQDHEESSVVISPPTTKDLAAELERIRESRMCKVCMDAEMDVVYLPCSHMVTCASCAVSLAVCPICRMDIKYTIKPILS